MWRRFPDTNSYTVLLTRVLFWMSLAKCTFPQEFPSTDPDYVFALNEKNLFYDTNAIPDGIEVSPYLFENKTKK